MSRPGVILPVLQNWSCHNCGGCCREHQIGITEDEKRRIEQQTWTAADGLPSDRPLIVPFGKGYRLNHQDDGACVFLDERGLCRIHAKFGEPAKPLACQVYPYAIHPAGSSVTVSLRFSCPSVVQNLGIPVTQQREAIERLAQQIVPKNYQTPNAPELFAGQALNWQDFTRILAFLERGISDNEVGFATRLVRILTWLELLEMASSIVLSGEPLADLLRSLNEVMSRAQPDDDLEITDPSRIGKLMFRQLVAQLLRHDTAATARRGLIGRLGLLGQGLRYTLGRGRVPALDDPVSVRVAFSQEEQTTVGPGAASLPESQFRSRGPFVPSERHGRPTFRDLEARFSGRSRAFDELFSRYFRLKVQGIHFCGSAYYDYSLIDGFRSLALMYPATLWVARLRAARDERNTLTLQDVQAALATVDHNFGYSPAFGLKSSRHRIRQLSRLQQVTALCGWYSL